MWLPYWGIRKEFAKLRRTLPLPKDLVLQISRKECQKTYKAGLYIPAHSEPNVTRPTIIVSHGRLTEFNVMTLLHEMCHAIQDQEQRLVPIPMTIEAAMDNAWDAYQCELETIRFAIETFSERYEIAYSVQLHLRLPPTETIRFAVL